MNLSIARRFGWLSLICLIGLPFLLRARTDSIPSARAGLVRETAHMKIKCASHTSTLLPNGKVLIAGGFGGSGTEGNPFRTSELYDPRTRSFSPAADMSIGRSGHTATLLRNGKVLMVGGWTGRYQNWRSAELYDPATNKFTATGDLVIERAGSTATLLADGRVLIAGGVNREENALASAEIYDPATGKFTLTGNMSDPRGAHTATALNDGKILITGGGSGHYPSQTVYRSAEIFDPATGKFTPAGQMTLARHKHAAILLSSGRVLILGGSDNRDWHGEYASAEIYDPARGSFAPAGEMATPRFKILSAVALLSNGKVLIAGGGNFAEVYDESKGTFRKVEGTLGSARFFTSAISLPGSQALISGGYADSGHGLPSTSAAWLYQP